MTVPTVVPPKFTKQVMVLLEPEVSAESYAWAEHRGVSASAVHRELIEASLDAKRKEWETQYGPLPDGAVLRFYQEHRAQGEAQVSTRREYGEGRKQ